MCFGCTCVFVEFQPSNLHLPPTIPAVGLLQHPLLDSQDCFNDLKESDLPTLSVCSTNGRLGGGGVDDISGAEITNLASFVPVEVDLRYHTFFVPLFIRKHWVRGISLAVVNISGPCWTGISIIAHSTVSVDIGCQRKQCVSARLQRGSGFHSSPQGLLGSICRHTKLLLQQNCILPKPRLGLRE